MNHWNLWGYSDEYDPVAPFFAMHWTNDNLSLNSNDFPSMIRTDNTYFDSIHH